ITNLGSVSNEIDITILDSANQDVTDNYVLHLTLGSLTVNARELGFSTPSADKIYDGLPLEMKTYDFLYGRIAGNHYLQVTMNSTITAPGQIVNDLYITIFNEFNEDVTEFYIIQKDLGMLTVSPKPILISTPSAEKMYDGLPLNNWTWTLETGIMGFNHYLDIQMSASITTPGSIVNDLSVTVHEEGTELDVTQYYEISLDLGTLTVYPRQIVISTMSAEKTYDGIPLMEQSWSFTSGVLGYNHFITFVMTSQITTPGTIDNEITVTVRQEPLGEGLPETDVSAYYDIIYEFGTLTVNPGYLYIQSAGSSRTYNGLVLSNSQYDIVDGYVANDQMLLISFLSEIKDVGSIPNDFQVNIVDQQSHDVTDYYQIVLEFGTLTVLPRPITIGTESLEKEYDGTPLTSSVWSLQLGLMANDQFLNVSMTSSITNPGIIDNGVDVTIMDAENVDVTNNYAITYDLGTLTVFTRTLIFQTESLEKEYDGLPLVSDVWTLISGVLPSAHHMEVSMNNQITNAGSIENGLVVTILDESNQNVTSHYDIIYDFGTLTVLSRYILIETGSLSKFYDGLPLTNSEWTMRSGTIADNQRMEYTMNASITNPGMVENRMSLTIYDAGNQNVTANYDLVFEFGTLEISARRLTLETESVEKEYDGLPLTSASWLMTSGALADNHTMVVVMNASITNAGSIDNDIAITIFDAENVDVTEYYDVTYELGQLTVFPRSLQMATANAEKIYDALPLTNQDWILLTGSVLANHHMDVVMNAQITNVGTLPNAIIVTIYDDFNQDVSDNYDITYFLGTLSVFRQSLTIATETASKIYDGLPLTSQEWSIQSGELVVNQWIDFAMNSSITNVGTINNVIQ
ncbi:MAG: hypothetical protein PHP32_07700, partial [Candidatus Izemoplasmatales bacterium]|nr:hypothetical protein [Candidatus Izemoplasmatales bacterium]